MTAFLISVCLMLTSYAAHAEQFKSDDAMILRIAHRFKTTLDKSGINGVGRDVLKCYDDNLENKNATKECLIYDVAVLMFDHQMRQVFVARGMNVSPSPLYTNQAFDVRSHTYGFPAFANNEAEKQMVGPAAKQVLDKAFH